MMHEPSEPMRPEALLAHAGWLRRLARGLVSDPASVDDVVQETMLAALEHPPRDPGRLRGWLRTVARNVVRARGRSEGRRGSREREARPPRPGSDPATAVARLEIHRRLVDLVHELSEPTRTTILLRYFDGMRPHEIATRLGLTPSTVRSRISRGLDVLRRRLDGEHGGRKAWSSALLPLAAHPLLAATTTSTASTGTALLMGGLLVSTKAKLVLAIGVVILLVLLGWRLADVPTSAHDPAGGRPDLETARDDSPTGESPGDAPSTATGESASGSTGFSEEGRPGEAAARTSEDPEVLDPSPPAGTITGRVRVPDGDTLVDVKVALLQLWAPVGAPNRPGEIDVLLDEDGSFAVADLGPGGYRITATHPGLAECQVSVRLAESEGKGPIAIAMQIAGAIRVRLFGEDGGPRAGERIRVSGPVSRSGDTDREGGFLAGRLPAGRYQVHLRRRDTEVTRTVVLTTGETAEIAMGRGARLSGTLFAPAGTVLKGAYVRLHPRPVREGYQVHRATVDGEGRYEIDGLATGEYEVSVQVFRPRSYVASIGLIRLEDGEDREHPIHIPHTGLSGRITTAKDGTPLNGAQIQVSAWPVRLEGDRIVEHDQGRTVSAFPDKDGRYTFVGVTPGTYVLWITPIRPPPVRPEWRIVEVPHSGLLENVDIALEAPRWGETSVRVIAPEGTEPPTVSFSIVTWGRRGDDRIRVMTEGVRKRPQKNGAHLLTLPVGRQILTVSAVDHRSDPREIEVRVPHPGEVTFRLVPVGRLEVTLLDPEGAPVEAATFTVRRGDGTAAKLETYALRPGVFRLVVDAGEAVVEARANEGVTGPIKESIRKGETLKRTVRLRAGR